jgi:hypothetical protein
LEILLFRKFLFEVDDVEVIIFLHQLKRMIPWFYRWAFQGFPSLRIPKEYVFSFDTTATALSEYTKFVLGEIAWAVDGTTFILILKTNAAMINMELGSNIALLLHRTELVQIENTFTLSILGGVFQRTQRLCI